MIDVQDQAQKILTAYGCRGARVAPLGTGLINATFLVQDKDQAFVLQRVNRIFAPEVNRDIDIVTRHLASSGMITPTIVPTQTGELWVTDGGENWRLLTHIDGVSRDSLTDSRQATEAGRLLARFHRTVSDLDYRFTNARLGVHDTARHLQALETALADHQGHAEYGSVRPLALEILAIAGELPKLPVTPDRIVHGDPKINNILFAPETDTALCLIDLDTIGPMPLPLELGDAFRSWCDPAGEDQQDSGFSAELFAPAVAGYAEAAGSWIKRDEWSAIVPATFTILVELAARFCADALNESYFGWNSERFASLSEHNQVRAAGQLALARSLQSQADTLQHIVDAAF